MQLLDSGDALGALKEHEAIQQYMEDHHVPLEERREVEWRTFKAVCYLRMGENENCLTNHNADSCIFPIHGKGVHTLERGSRGAVAVLNELLDRYATISLTAPIERTASPVIAGIRKAELVFNP